MENLTTQSSLRSLDELGRPLTAGRPSLPLSNSDQFEGHLERAREDTREQERVADRRSAGEKVSKPREKEAAPKAEQDRTGETEQAPEVEEFGVQGSDSEQVQEEAAPTSEDSPEPKDEGPDSPDPSESLSIVQPVATPTNKPLSFGLAQLVSDGEQAGAFATGLEEGPEAQAGAQSTVLLASSESSARSAPSVQPGQGAPVSGVPENRPVANTPAGGPEQAPQAAADPERIARAESILSQVRLRLGNGLRSATLALHPAELGRIQVQIDVESGSVRAELRVESAEALSALERHLPELRALLTKDGQEASHVELSLAPEGSFDKETQDSPHSRSHGGSSPSESEDTPVPESSLVQSLVEASGVDFLA